MVRLHFKNNSTTPLYAMECFGIKAFQDGVELDFVSDARGYENRPGRLEKAGDELSFAYNWKELYGELRPGNYRITVNVNTLGEGIDKTYGYNIDFTISEPDERLSEEFDDLALSVTSVMQDSEKTELGLRLVNTLHFQMLLQNYSMLVKIMVTVLS